MYPGLPSRLEREIKQIYLERVLKVYTGWGQKYELLVGWGKDIMDLLRKNANKRGKRWNKREFSVYLGNKYYFGKRGAKISNIWIIYTPAQSSKTPHQNIIKM